MQRPGVVAMAGFYALALYLFFYLSRFFDVVGFNLKITMILNLVFWAAALIIGGLFTFIQSRVGFFVAAFYGCMILSFPFSVWRGGSMEHMTIAMRSVLLMASILALTISTAWTLRLMYVIGYAMATAGTLSIIFGEQSERGRLALSAGTLSDPNYYAMGLLMGLPFLLLKANNESHPFKRALPLLAVLPVLYSAIQTGSRGGMLAMGVMFTVFFVRSGMRERMLLMVAVVVGIFATVVMFPDDLLYRYRTIFSPAEAEATTEQSIEDQEAAAASANARWYLFRRSLELTFLNPLFGVGPGMFAVAENDDAKEKGVKGAWHETHNTYTQVSSEIGIPGAILYVSALLVALRSVYRLSKARPLNPDPHWEKVRNGAFYLHLSLITVMSGAMFLSIAYTGVLFILMGLSAGLERTAQREYQFAPAPRGFAPAMAPSVPAKRPRHIVGQNV